MITLKWYKIAGRLIRHSLGLALVAGLALSPAGATTTAPAGPVAQVSLANGADQLRPAAAMDAQGNAVVVWQGYNPASASYDIFARRYAADGAALGDPFVANQFTAGKQSRPAVALDADGDFVVAWDGAGPSGDGQEIWLRRFAADGTPRSGDLLAPRNPAGSQFDPAVALDADGDFVVAWQGSVPGDAAGVAFQRFNRDGVALAAVDVVPHTGAAAAGEQSTPSVAIDADGDFAVAWETYSYDGVSETIKYEIALRPYSAAGVAQSQPQPVATVSGSAVVRDPSLATLPDGRLAVAWEYAGGPVDDTQIELAIRSRSAQTAAAPLRVSPPAAARRYNPALAVNSAGMLIVTWGDSTTRSGDAPVGLASRYVTDMGVLSGEVFYPALPGGAGVGTTVISAAAAAVRPDTWLVVWDSEPAGAASAAEVYLRRYVGVAVLIGAASPLQLIEGAPGATLSVALRTAPGANVTITLTPQSSRVALGAADPGTPLQLTFTPANATIPQNVAIRVLDDALPQGDAQSALSLAVATGDTAYASAPLLINGVAGTSLPVTLIDNDTELNFIVYLPSL